MRLPVSLRAGTAAVLAGLATALPLTSASAEPVVVVELFTSQGCPNCPPADAFLGELIERGDVIGLSLPVDIWDLNGWEDTLATADNGERFLKYAEALTNRMRYTPFFVVDGAWNVPGSNPEAIEAAIASVAAAPSVDVSIDVAVAGLHIEIGDAPDNADGWRGTIWLVTFDEMETVEVGFGENAGRTLNYHNVVLDRQRIGMWNGTATAIDWPMDELEEVAADGCVILIQRDLPGGLPGEILGAAIFYTP